MFPAAHASGSVLSQGKRRAKVCRCAGHNTDVPDGLPAPGMRYARLLGIVGGPQAGPSCVADQCMAFTGKLALNWHASVTGAYLAAGSHISRVKVLQA